jgi:hypothetical protein
MQLLVINIWHMVACHMVDASEVCGVLQRVVFACSAHLALCFCRAAVCASLHCACWHRRCCACFGLAYCDCRFPSCRRFSSCCHCMLWLWCLFMWCLGSFRCEEVHQSCLCTSMLLQHETAMKPRLLATGAAAQNCDKVPAVWYTVPLVLQHHSTQAWCG